MFQKINMGTYLYFTGGKRIARSLALFMVMVSLTGFYNINDKPDLIDPYRVVILTDMTHDDGNSLIRYLYYAHEFETEAIIITPQLPDFQYNSDEPWQKGQRILGAYEQEYAQLKKHHADYPSPDSLRAVTKRGRGALPIIWLTNEKKFSGNISGRSVTSSWGEIEFSDWIGEGVNPNGEPKDSEGSDFLVKLFEEEDDRPIFVESWGGPITFIQALYRFREKHSREEYYRLLNKLHIYGILLQDITFDFLINLDDVQAQDCANMGTVSSTYDGERTAPRWLLHDAGHFWYYVWSGDSGYVKPMTETEVNGHGLLSELYDHGGEGDTPSFLYLLSARLGLNDPLDPTQGSWGSLFRPMGDPFPAGYFHTCGVDRDHLVRWVDDVKNSFLNRLNYSVREPDEVNREPVAMIKGYASSEPVVHKKVMQGEAIMLDASDSYDPDGDSLLYRWYYYQEASNASSIPEIKQPGAQKIHLEMPSHGKNADIHLILEVKDTGMPALKSYRRVIFELTDHPRQQETCAQTSQAKVPAGTYHHPVRITCMGNSITQGKVDKKTEPDSITEMSYRFRLWEMLDSAGYDIDFTGYWNRWFVEDPSNPVEEPRSSYTGKLFDRDHDAYYGIRTGGFLNGSERWPDGRIPPLRNRILDQEKGYRTDVALIHLGTNDPDSIVGESVENLREIIRVIREENPAVTIVLAKLMTPWKAVNNEIDALAASEQQQASQVVLVDMSKGFINDPSKEGAMTFDWVHPNRAGQEYMARRWFSALEQAVFGNLEKPVITGTRVQHDGTMVRWEVERALQAPTGYNIYLDGKKLNREILLDQEYEIDNRLISGKSVQLQISIEYGDIYLTLYSDPLILSDIQ